MNFYMTEKQQPYVMCENIYVVIMTVVQQHNMTEQAEVHLF